MPVNPGHADQGGRRRGVVVRRSSCSAAAARDRRRRRRRRRRQPAVEDQAGDPYRHEDRRADLHGHVNDLLQPADASSHHHSKQDLDHEIHGRRHGRLSSSLWCSFSSSLKSSMRSV